MLHQSYDVGIIGSGLAGMTAANGLAKMGHKVLLLEQHAQCGGLAAYFKRPGGYTFDVSLHGFPVGMIKSCRRYWNAAIAASIVKVPNIRFINPQFQFTTPFDRTDFTQKLIQNFHVPPDTVERFFQHLRAMNFYDPDKRTTGELFEEFFPHRPDVHRLLLEPITYANGSTLEDPAVAYGIVFSNFMAQGVYTFLGGTDQLIAAMRAELTNNGVTIATRTSVDKIFTQKKDSLPTVVGLQCNGQTVTCNAVLSNANLKATLLTLLEPSDLDPDFQHAVQAVRLNNSSCQVYIGLKEGCTLPNDLGDLIFMSDAPVFSSAELKQFNTQSRTFSIYTPQIRPESPTPRYTIVASTNALWNDWAALSDTEYKAAKEHLKQTTLQALERLVPNISAQIGWIEVATPRTFHRYTRHWEGASFGTKFEGLKISMDLPTHIHGLFHAGSVGIIMSGWLGTINYGMIVANKIDQYLRRFIPS